MRKQWLLGALSLVVLAGGWAVARSAAEPSQGTPAGNDQINEVRIQALLDEMRSTDLDKLAALDIKPLELPPAGVDVMRVRLEETYDIAGIGKDTVELKGWIAVKHDNTRPAQGERVLTWNSAVTDTEFVGMELHGESPVFGHVAITLDETQPSAGQVGKLSLPFVTGSILNVSYQPYRTLYRIDQVAANRVQGPAIALAADQAESKADSATIVTGTKARPVIAVIDGVLKAITARDAKAMSRYYSPSGNNLFFGPVNKGVARGSAEYIRELSKSLSSVKSFEAKRNDDVQVRLSGNLAVATLTGTNTVVTAKEERGSSPWRWTVELERGKGGNWLITHDHISFTAVDPSQPIDRQGLSDAVLGAACKAEVSVSVKMDALDLQMRTAVPVVWYSEVETIPPVGAIASVSVNPAPLVANGRSVGTLQHGAVKFREVVRHVPLVDVRKPGQHIAASGNSGGTGGR